jgi:hypothetical protein
MYDENFLTMYVYREYMNGKLHEIRCSRLRLDVADNEVLQKNSQWYL